jgi:hypothetical protein
MRAVRRAIGLVLILVVAECAASAQSERDRSQILSGSGSVSGRVTLGGEPAPNIIVRAVYLDGDDGAENTLGKGVTDADGRFVVAGLPAGRVVLKAHAPASALSPEAGVEGRSVTLAEGEFVEGVDIALIHGGVVTGRIVDQENRPIVGLPVRAIGTNGRRGSWLRDERTDDRGIYRIFGLEAGDYRIRTSPDYSVRLGRKTGSYQATFYPGTTDEWQAVAIEVTAHGETRNVDFVVRKSGGGFAAAGRVVDSRTGRPAASVFVVAHPQTPTGPTDFDVAPAMSDSRGTFRISGLKPGRYKLMSFNLPGRTSDTYADPVVFDVAAADVTGLEVRLEAGATIEGRITVEGAQADATIDLSTVRLYCVSQTIVGSDVDDDEDEDDSSDFAPAGATRVGADGTFVVEGIRPGRATIGFDPWNGSRRLTLLRIERDGVEIPDSFDVAAGERITGVRIVTALGVGKIRGIVKVKGAPLATFSVLVSVRRTDGSDRSGQQTVPADPRGHFVLGGLRDGEYDVTATLSPESAQGGTPTRYFSGARRATVSGQTPVEVTIEVDVSKAPPQRDN